MIPEKQNPEQNPGKGQRTAETGIKDGDKGFRQKSRKPETDAATHHHRHDKTGFQIKKMPHRPPFFAVTLDPFRVLHTHFKEHQTKNDKDGGHRIGKQHHRNITGKAHHNSKPKKSDTPRQIMFQKQLA